MLEWRDDDGVKHQWSMPLCLIAGRFIGCQARAAVWLNDFSSKAARDLLMSYLQVFPVKTRARCVDKLGWHGNIFVTAAETIGQSSALVVFQNTNAIEPALSVSGTVNEWRDSMGNWLQAIRV